MFCFCNRGTKKKIHLGFISEKECRMRGKTAEGRKNNEDGSGRDEAERGNKRVTFKSNTDKQRLCTIIQKDLQCAHVVPPPAPCTRWYLPVTL